MQGSRKKATKLRQQASVEAEVAQSRLALAKQDFENGETELGLRRAVEAAFDAGVAHGYAKESNQTKFATQMKGFVQDAQLLAAMGGGDTQSCDKAYKAGKAYAKARSRNKDSEIQQALERYETAIEEIGVGRAPNPGPTPQTCSTMSVGRLKARLLR